MNQDAVNEYLEADQEATSASAEEAVVREAEQGGDGTEVDAREQLQAELQAVQEQLMRQAAEFQNYRRRSEQEKGRLTEFTRGQVVQQFLDIVDDLRRSLEAAEQVEAQEEPGPAFHAFKEGVELVFRKFTDELTRLGVTPIEAVGKPFNEEEHEALMQQPAPDGTPAGIVLGEIQKGYRMGDRVLRHSRVVVSA